MQAEAKYHLGQVVCHKKHPFRGVIFDVDPEFSNTDEWYGAIPEEARPVKDQPFYHLLTDGSVHESYVSQQNLCAAMDVAPVQHAGLEALFTITNGQYIHRYSVN